MVRFVGVMVVCALMAVLAGPAAASPVKGEEVEYRAGSVVMKGYLIYDEKIKGRRPGVLVVHEWWGHNEYTRMRARMLAELGYAALAVDMYGEGKSATHPDDARKFSSELTKNFALSKARFLAAMEFLKNQPFVDPTRIAAIGYCFGGGVVLNMAREGLDLRGVASFHGSLMPVRPARPGVVKARILVLHGAADKFVPPEQIEAFKKEMKEAAVDFRFIAYPGALHSFTNPEADVLAGRFNMPVGYDAEADTRSWGDLKVFLGEVFGK